MVTILEASACLLLAVSESEATWSTSVREEKRAIMGSIAIMTSPSSFEALPITINTSFIGDVHINANFRRSDDAGWTNEEHAAGQKHVFFVQERRRGFLLPKSDILRMTEGDKSIYEVSTGFYGRPIAKI